jgi:hypothetical protein
MSHAAISVFPILCAISFNLLAINSIQNRTEDTTSQNKRMVELILNSPADGSAIENSQEAPLFQALTNLAKSQGKNPDEYTTFRRDDGTFSPLTGGRATALRSGQKNYVLVILGAPRIGVPGISAQQLILLNEDGQLLDKVSCDINSRYGEVVTEVKEDKAPDGAQVIMVFKSNHPSSWHNWHAITYGGSTSTFWESEKDLPSIWNKQGLCRIKVEDDRFVIVFPKKDVHSK